MLRDERWPVARLIPITSATGVEARERNAASALLAVLSVVDEFGRSLLKPLGAPAGKIESFVEVPFKLESGQKVRPDGLIGVSRAGRTWWCLVECKVADQQLTAEQMEMYLDLARANSIDAVLSISNHYATKSSDYPIELDRKKRRKMAIHHWSWVRVLTEAEVQKQYRGVKDPDQAYILGELIPLPVGSAVRRRPIQRHGRQLGRRSRGRATPHAAQDRSRRRRRCQPMG